MNKHPVLSLTTGLLIVAGAVLVIAQTNNAAGVTNSTCCANLTKPVLLASMVAASTNAPAVAPVKKGLPKLLDLGAGKCIPCKMMTPILEQLKTEYAGALEVEFIDVWKNPDAGKQCKIEVIPAQIFYDATGKELFRHIGFFAKEDILAKWQELGVELKTAKKSTP